jgi:hypothetical protein
LSIHCNYRSVAPLVEVSRCLLYFLFDTYVISSWMDSSLAPHLRGLTESVLTVVRVVHFMSIVLWLMVWLSRTNRRCKETYDKLSLMKEDKYIDNYTIDKNRTDSWRVGRRMAFMGGAVSSFVILFMVFALRFDECTQFLNPTKVEL